MKSLCLNILIFLFFSSFAFGQTEALKVVVNELALYKQKKEVKILGDTKKSIDSLIKAAPDSLDLERNVYKALVCSIILYSDSTNKLNNPPGFFGQTVNMVEKLSGRKKIYRFEDEMQVAKQCLANIYIRKAFVFLNKTDYSNALQLFENAQNYAPNFRPLIAYIAFCNNKLGHFNTAARLFSKLVESDDTKVEYIETASNIYKALGDTTLALGLIQKGLKMFPKDRSMLLDEANIYSNKGDYQSLAPLLPLLFEMYNSNADIAFIGANCYDHLNQYDKAITNYLRAIDLNNSAYEPIFNLGILFLKQSEAIQASKNSSEIVQAKQWLEKANEISPNDKKCLIALQMVYTKTGDERQIKNIDNKLKQINNQ